jgi:hypothetical protein
MHGRTWIVLLRLLLALCLHFISSISSNIFISSCRALISSLSLTLWSVCMASNFLVRLVSLLLVLPYLFMFHEDNEAAHLSIFCAIKESGFSPTISFSHSFLMTPALFSSSFQQASNLKHLDGRPFPWRNWTHKGLSSEVLAAITFMTTFGNWEHHPVVAKARSRHSLMNSLPSW